MNENLPAVLDELDQSFAENGIGVVDVAVAFSKFLYSLLVSGRVKANKDTESEFKLSLSRASNLLSGEISDEEIIRIRRKMADIEGAYEKVDKGTACYARCVANCFVGEKEWQHDSDGPNTPIYYHLYYLEFSVPEIHAEFISYFRGYFGIKE